MNQSTLYPRAPIVEHCLEAWTDGADSVDPVKLISRIVAVHGKQLKIGEQAFDLNQIERIRVVGAGKAGRDMIVGLEKAIGGALLIEKRVSGWVNVPAIRTGSVPQSNIAIGSGRPLIWPFAARPAGENLPTDDCYAGTLLIKDIVARTGSKELCVALFSGGGSALLSQPAGHIRLDEKRQLIQWMSSNGASIRQLNTVRKNISAVKGGRLAKSFTGKQLVSLILSDVLGDPLDLIASGPTVQDNSSQQEAIEILKQFDSKLKNVPRRIVKHLQRSAAEPSIIVPDNVSNIVIGNIETAMDEAELSLDKRGYHCTREIQNNENELADAAGKRLARWIIDRLSANDLSQPVALISGGEPVVKLSTNPGAGGRNQQLVLAALCELTKENIDQSFEFTLISAGTDGEDGNTTVAGAYIDRRSVEIARDQKLDPIGSLKRHDAFTFFSKRLQRGVFPEFSFDLPKSRTNVCDLRIALVAPKVAT